MITDCQVVRLPDWVNRRRSVHQVLIKFGDLRRAAISQREMSGFSCCGQFRLAAENFPKRSGTDRLNHPDGSD